MNKAKKSSGCNSDVPILVSWLGDTELKVMAKNGADEEKAVAIGVLRGDKDVEDKVIQDKLRELDLERAYSSLHLILGDAGDSHSEFAPPKEIPVFKRILLLFSRSHVRSFEDFRRHYCSFLVSTWKKHRSGCDIPSVCP